MYLIKIVDYLLEFKIVISSKKGNDRYPIIEMKSKGVDIVVDNGDVFEVDALEDPQIFDVKALFRQESAVLTKVSMLDQFSIRI